MQAEPPKTMPGLRDVLDHLFAFVAVLGPAGHVLDTNRPPLDAADLEPEDVRDQPFWDCYWWAYDPSVQAQVRSACARAAAGRASRFDVDARMAGGRLMTIDMTVRPYSRGRGLVSHLIVSGLDVTGRKRQEDELRLSASLMKEAIDQSEALIWINDVDGRLVLANVPLLELLGRRAPDVIGRTFAELLANPDEARRLAEHDGEALAAGRPSAHEEDFTAQGRTTTWLCARSPHRDPAGNVLGVIGVCVDVTRQRQTLEGLRQADQQKDAFIAMLSHELRNPLSPIVVATHILQSHEAPDAATRGALDILLRQTRQMERLLDDLLDVARITRNRLDLQMERVDLVQCVQDAVHSSQALIGDKQHELALHVPGEPALLRGDPVRLTQVITNLVNNAARYAPRGSHVDVTVEVLADEVVLRVEDDGPGIPAEILPRLFDGSCQAGAQRHGKQGLGIGLWLTHRLVSLHRGTIAVENKPEGGARFTVRLPRS